MYYYSFMNLTKIAINLNKFEGSAKKYVHGISESINAASKLSNVEIMMWQSKGSNISISEYLLKLLEDPVPAYAPSGSGNAVTAVSISGDTLTYTLGSTFAMNNHTHSNRNTSS